MTEDEKKEWAIYLIEQVTDRFEFSDVYENENLEDEDEQTWSDIFDYMYKAKITIKFED